jgi:hypothetical protein
MAPIYEEHFDVQPQTVEEHGCQTGRAPAQEQIGGREPRIVWRSRTTWKRNPSISSSANEASISA